jgi:D-beta-D-heptose 7-phosphate kinase/D-beta-D-heptose 1-phosphate adenosyltransferase
MPHDAVKILNKLPQAAVLSAGDLILDQYVYGEASRLSPEAPVPIVLVRRKTFAPGGLGNVVMNISALGAKSIALGIVGQDKEAGMLEELLKKSLGKPSPKFIVDPERPTTVKTRVIAGIQQVVRFDEESIAPISRDIEKKYQKALEPCFFDAGAITISDYGKGLLTRDLLTWLIARANDHDIPAIADPKGADYSRYKGAFLVTPNRQELSEALGRNVTKEPAEALASAGHELMRRHKIRNLLITRSEDGMTLVEQNGTVTHFPTVAKAVFDVSGAGDTVVAAVAASLASGSSLQEAAYLATLAAGVVVGKVGTASASPEEIMEFLEIAKLKIRSQKQEPKS